MSFTKRERGLTVFRKRYNCVSSKVVSMLLSDIGGLFPLGVAELLDRKMVEDVISVEIDPCSYGIDQVDEFREDYLAAEVMSKYPDFDLGIDTAKVALAKFVAAEDQCFETNQRLKSLNVNGIVSRVTPDAILHCARGKIAGLLGSFSWDLAEHGFAFGPNASTRCKRSRGDAYYKFGTSKPHVTSNCAVAGLTAIYREPRWFIHLARLSGQFQPWFDSVSCDESLGRSREQEQLSHSSELLAEVRSRFDIYEQCKLFMEIVDGNRVGTVPKNAKTDRVIAIEPDLNMYLQTGIGDLIRKALRHVRVDLNDQSRNQRLARIGSKFGCLTTLDLSSASDTVALRLVEELMPPDWYAAILVARSERGVMPDGSKVRYQKVSSMGNGFTFELESLIFWALTAACQHMLRPAIRCVVVYGDDIICPTEISHTVKWILGYAGFSVNRKKSFDTGGFRESCGKHYLFGRDVTPFYVREPVDNILRLFWLANQIRRWARRSAWLDARCKGAYDYVVGILPVSLRRPSIPDSLGDLALFGDFDECSPRRVPQYLRDKKKPCGFEGYFAKGYIEEATPCVIPDDEPYLIRQLEKLAGHRWVFDPVRKVMVARGDGVPTPSRRKQLIVRPCEPLVVQWKSYGPWA